MVSLILSIYSFFSKRKLLLFGLLSLLIAFLAFSASRINFKEDISAFLPKGHDNERINYAYQHIGSANKLLVSISIADTSAKTSSQNTDEELIIHAINHLVGQLRQMDSSNFYLKKIEYKIEQQQILEVSQFLVKNMPYFFTESDYQRLDTLLMEENIRAQMHNNKQMLMSPMGMVMKQTIVADPLFLSAPILSGLRDFQVSEQFQLYDDYIFTKDKKEGIITIESQFPVSESRQNAELLKIIDRAAGNTQLEFEQQVKIHYFGSVDIAVTNANRIKKDTLLSSIIAILLILSILIYAFRSAKNLVVMFGSIVFGWLFAVGLLTILKDEVSLIAVGISSIIIGIAMNYPLHFILHHYHEHRISKVIKNIVVPLTIGNITTVGAFLSLMLISSSAMRDLGLFASLLLVGTICFALVFLPHLLKKNVKTGTVEMEHLLVFGKLLSWKPKRNKWTALLFIVLTILFFILSFNTKFETDMQKINYMTKSQKEDFKKLLSLLEQGQQTIYFVSEGKCLDDALMAYESSKVVLDRLQTAGTLSKVNGLGVYLPSKSTQQQRLARWKSFCESKKKILDKMDEIGVENGFKSGAFRIFDEIVNKNYETQEIDFFEPLTSMFANNFIVNEAESSMVMTILYTMEKDLDQLESELNLINTQSFSFDAGTIGRSMVTALSGDFNKVLFICGFVVFIFLLITLGRIELSLLAFLPLTVGWFWILGIMDIFDIRFNVVNIILASFIFGMGDDYTIFITEGLMYEYSYKRKMLKTYKNTILMSALIMFIGIGALILAQHPALRSLAEITIIGMGSVVLMAFLLPPLIFKWLTLKKGKRRLMPITLVNFASSLYAFIVFLIGSIIISTTGFFFFTLGKTTHKKKFRYHQLLCWVSRFVVMRIPRVKTTFNNFDKTIFDKPAVIICNHQSHIDLMCIMSLSPKLIVLTNEWVWNSPFYGRLIKYADFYPVANGIGNAIDKLRAIVEDGYSVMIFPEGTRSEDCSIQRFHQGAFFLAEQLNLDVVPVLIHGVGHLLPKKEFMLRKGEIHIKVMNRVAPQGYTFGNAYRERAKNFRQLYKEEYAKLAVEVETPNYFSDLVIHNYIYKGPSIERAVRRNLKKHSNYSDIIHQLSGCKNVLIMNSGYGELPLLLSLVHKSTNITAVENDPDKLELAANCSSVSANLHYVSELKSEEVYRFDAVVVKKGFFNVETIPSTSIIVFL